MNRRQLIAALSLTPWVKPVVNSVVLPAHAVTSEPISVEIPTPDPVPVDPVEPKPVPDGFCQVTVNNLPDNFLIEIRDGTRIVSEETESEFFIEFLDPGKLEIWVYELDTPNQDFMIYRPSVTEYDCRIVIEHVRFDP